MKNIIWKKSDGGIAISHIVDATSSKEEALKLKNRGDIPTDWEVIAFDTDIPQTREWRNAWKWSKKSKSIEVDTSKAQDMTTERLRVERKPLLEALDTNYMRAIETGNKAEQETIIAEKQRLRDITETVNTVTDLLALKSIKC